LLVAVCLVVSGVSAKSKHKQMTTEVVAGAEDCFYLGDVKIGQTMSVEYQVTSSSAATGNNDITARVLGPKPEVAVLFESIMQKDGSYTGEAGENGDFKVCFDNTQSSWSDKVVWFEIALEDPEDDYDEDDDDYFDDEDWDKLKANNEDTQTLFDMKIEDVKTSVHDVRINVGKMRHFQFLRSTGMSKDTNQMESNLSRLNFWSLLHLGLMLLVGVSQVYMVRQLFEDKSSVHKLMATT